MSHSDASRFVALLALTLMSCGAQPSAEAEEPVARWEKTRDGYIQIDTGSSFRQITRCWTIGDGLSDCVWIGGSANQEQGSDSFSAERWFTSGLPETAGPLGTKIPEDAYYSCFLNLEEGRLLSVQEYLSRGDGTPLLNNERWLESRRPRAAWSLEDLVAWSKRTGIELASPLTDCELIGRMVETGGWTALASGRWTSPLSTAADGLATIAP